MSEYLLNTLQIGNDTSNPTKNFTIKQGVTAGVADGRLIISRGNAGAEGSPLLTINADNTIVFNPVGTVAQVAGIPTGQIIESGSNANGSYTKWADGTMICHIRATYGASSINVASGALFISPGVVGGLTYPKPFISPPKTTLTVESSSGLVWATPNRAGTATTSSQAYLVSTSSGSPNCDLLIHVIGRWF